MSENTQHEKEQEVTANAAEEMEQRVADEQEEQQPSTTEKFIGRMKSEIGNLIVATAFYTTHAAYRVSKAKQSFKDKAQLMMAVAGAKATKKFITSTVDSSSYDTATVKDLMDMCDFLIEMSNKDSTK